MIESLQHLLYDPSPRISDLGKQIKSTLDAYEAKTISEPEFLDLLKDIDVSKILIDESIALQIRGDIGVCVLGLLAIYKQFKI